jgi:hypothetical protein
MDYNLDIFKVLGLEQQKIMTILSILNSSYLRNCFKTYFGL